MVHSLLRKLVLFISLCLPIIQAWNEAGRNAICTIAQAYLEPSTVKAMSVYIPDGTLTKEICNWSYNHETEYPWSTPLHYAYTPEWNCTYIQERDCHSYMCIDGAIQNYTNRLLSVHRSKEDIQFLVSFVGDSNQPLRSGFNSDKGGKLLYVLYDEQFVSLFDLWETVFINQRVKGVFHNDINTWVKYLLDTYHPNINLYCETCSKSWCMLNAQNACSYAYRDIDGTKIIEGTKLTQGYYLKSLTIIENQIVTAGLELARLLNYIFK